MDTCPNALVANALDNLHVARMRRIKVSLMGKTSSNPNRHSERRTEDRTVSERLDRLGRSFMELENVVDAQISA